ncbi:hypothetical protein GMRT_12594 [Giardia muris]|uniref:Uncharacterized protein n=1 Tax=Giardia muris TaxID=5742 RepID=A0A4Z1SRE6_GIAMU|nr:hypothetical protein GMRT_12594 [Giardia muris]|eukprot:TNJ28462.1 hypothetical protein GMRT_12594 [Giardia muris]
MSGRLSHGYTDEEFAAVLSGNASDDCIFRVLATVVAKRDLKALERLQKEGPFEVQRLARRRTKIPAIARLLAAEAASSPPVFPKDRFKGSNPNFLAFTAEIKAYRNKTGHLPCAEAFELCLEVFQTYAFDGSMSDEFQAYVLHKFAGVLEQYAEVYECRATPSSGQRDLERKLDFMLKYYCTLYGDKSHKIYASDPASPLPLSKEARKTLEKSIIGSGSGAPKAVYPHEIFLQKFPKGACLSALHGDGSSSRVFIKRVMELNFQGLLDKCAVFIDGTEINTEHLDFRFTDTLSAKYFYEMQKPVRYPYSETSLSPFRTLLSETRKTVAWRNLENRGGEIPVGVLFGIRYMESEVDTCNSIVDSTLESFREAWAVVKPSAALCRIDMTHPRWAHDPVTNAPNHVASVKHEVITTFLRIYEKQLEARLACVSKLDRIELFAAKIEAGTLTDNDVYAGVSFEAVAQKFKEHVAGHDDFIIIKDLVSMRLFILLAKAIKWSRYPAAVGAILEQLSPVAFITKARLQTHRDAKIRGEVVSSIIQYCTVLGYFAEFFGPESAEAKPFLDEIRVVVEELMKNKVKILKDKEISAGIRESIAQHFSASENCATLLFLANLHDFTWAAAPQAYNGRIYTCALKYMLASPATLLEKNIKTFMSISTSFEKKACTFARDSAIGGSYRSPTVFELVARHPASPDEADDDFANRVARDLIAEASKVPLLPDGDSSCHFMSPMGPCPYQLHKGFFRFRPVSAPAPLSIPDRTSLLGLLDYPLLVEEKVYQGTEVTRPELSPVVLKNLEALCENIFRSRYARVLETCRKLPLQKELFSREHQYFLETVLGLAAALRDGSQKATVAFQSLHTYIESRVQRYNPCIRDEDAKRIAIQASQRLSDIVLPHVRGMGEVGETLCEKIFSTMLAGRVTFDELETALRAAMPSNDVAHVMALHHGRMAKIDNLPKRKHPGPLKFCFRVTKLDTFLSLVVKCGFHAFDIDGGASTATANKLIEHLSQKLVTEDAFKSSNISMIAKHRAHAIRLSELALLHRLRHGLASLLRAEYEVFLQDRIDSVQLRSVWSRILVNKDVSPNDYVAVRNLLLKCRSEAFVTSLVETFGALFVADSVFHMFYVLVCVMLRSANVPEVTGLSDYAKTYTGVFNEQEPVRKVIDDLELVHNDFGLVLLLVERLVSHGLLFAPDVVALTSTSKVTTSDKQLESRGTMTCCEHVDDITKVVEIAADIAGSTVASQLDLKAYHAAIKTIMGSAAPAAHRVSQVAVVTCVIIMRHIVPIAAEKSNRDLNQPPVPNNPRRHWDCSGPYVPMARVGGSVMAMEEADCCVCNDSALGARMMKRCAQPVMLMSCCAPPVAPDHHPKKNKGGRGRQDIKHIYYYTTSIVASIYRKACIGFVTPIVAALTMFNVPDYVQPFVTILGATDLSEAAVGELVDALDRACAHFTVASAVLLVKILTLPTILQHPKTIPLIEKKLASKHVDVDLVLLSRCVLLIDNKASMQLVNRFIDRAISRYNDVCDRMVAARAKDESNVPQELTAEMETALAYIEAIPTMCNPEARKNGDYLPRKDAEKYPVLVTAESERDVCASEETIRELIKKTSLVLELKNPLKLGAILDTQLAWYVNAAYLGDISEPVVTMSVRFIGENVEDSLGIFLPGADPTAFAYAHTKQGVVASACSVVVRQLIELDRAADLAKITEAFIAASRGIQKAPSYVPHPLYTFIRYVDGYFVKQCKSECCDGPKRHCVRKLLINLLKFIEDCFSLMDSSADFGMCQKLRSSGVSSQGYDVVAILNSVFEKHKEDSALLGKMGARFVENFARYGETYLPLSAELMNHIIDADGYPPLARCIAAKLASSPRLNELAGQLSQGDRLILLRF